MVSASSEDVNSAMHGLFFARYMDSLSNFLATSWEEMAGNVVKHILRVLIFPEEDEFLS